MMGRFYFVIKIEICNTNTNRDFNLYSNSKSIIFCIFLELFKCHCTGLKRFPTFYSHVGFLPCLAYQPTLQCGDLPTVSTYPAVVPESLNIVQFIKN